MAWDWVNSPWVSENSKSVIFQLKRQWWWMVIFGVLQHFWEHVSFISRLGQLDHLEPLGPHRAWGTWAFGFPPLSFLCVNIACMNRSVHQNYLQNHGASQILRKENTRQAEKTSHHTHSKLTCVCKGILILNPCRGILKQNRQRYSEVLRN